MVWTRRRVESVESTQGDLLEEPAGLWKGAMKRLLRRKTGVAGLIIISLMLIMAIFAPVIAPFDPTEDFIGEECFSHGASFVQ